HLSHLDSDHHRTPSSCNDTATTAICALSLHDALPISDRGGNGPGLTDALSGDVLFDEATQRVPTSEATRLYLMTRGSPVAVPSRSEEHTSELQSRENLVCRLLLEKKKLIQHHSRECMV